MNGTSIWDCHGPPAAEQGHEPTASKDGPEPSQEA